MNLIVIQPFIENKDRASAGRLKPRRVDVKNRQLTPLTVRVDMNYRADPLACEGAEQSSTSAKTGRRNFPALRAAHRRAASSREVLCYWSAVYL